MATYDLGDGVNLRHYVYDRNDALTDATVALGVTKPDGSSVPVTVSHTSTGLYDGATYTPDQVGDYVAKWTVTGAVTDVSTDYFTVLDPAPRLYTTLPLVKAQLSKDTDDIRDDLIQQAIGAASRKIDQICGRRFYPDAVPSVRTFSTLARSFTGPYGPAIWVDDIASATSLTVSIGTGGGSYASYASPILGPDNAVSMGQPITFVQGASGWASGVNSIQVTARWGWPRVPEEVSQAALILAARLYRRKDSPQGVISSADWGSVRVSRVDPDVEALISPYILPGFA